MNEYNYINLLKNIELSLIMDFKKLKFEEIQNKKEDPFNTK